MPRLLIAASGTGGHLFPALAVAEALDPSWSVQWLGVPDRLERQLVPSRYPLHTVRAGGLQSRGWRKLWDLVRLVRAIGAVRRLIHREGIELVFSTGGYIAAPAILAARWCGVPVVLHESNAIPGRVTRLLGPWCTEVAIGLAAAASRLRRCRPCCTGTPVRRAFLSPEAAPDWLPTGAGPLLVVMGGSQGALGLNRMVRPLLPKLAAAGVRVVHLTGSHDPDSDTATPPGCINLPFTDAMPALLQRADLVISRSGAGSLSELAVCGTPAILVPFPQAADRHQEANAAAAAALGAAVIVHQHPPENGPLERTLWRLLGPRLRGADPAIDPLTRLHAGMEQLAVRDADRRVAEMLAAQANRAATGPGRRRH